MLAATSLLFVPGSRADRFAKARAAGAGLTIIDLEDAVAPGEKESARSAALAQFADNASGWALRINALTTAAGITDLAALIAAVTMPAALLVPMVEAATEVEVVAKALGARCPALIPLIETPRGLRHAVAIAAVPGVTAVMFGGGDFAGELGVALAWEPLLGARQSVVLAAAEARVAAIDVPFLGLDDPAGLEHECRAAKALGFHAKAAIHPAQLAAIEAAFVPSAAEIAEAEEAIAAYAAGGERAIRFKGRMLEAPVVKRYRAVLSRQGTNDDA